MNAGPVPDLCPYCGVPIALDLDGRCQACRAGISGAMQSGQLLAHRAGDSGLVPHNLDSAVIAPFLYLTLATLGLLGSQPSIRQYTEAQPEAHGAIRALSAAVAAAGVRVRDSGKMRGEFDEALRFFTAEEIWMFDLAIDVIAMLGTGGGLNGGTRALIVSDLQSLYEYTNGHHWKKEVRKAGDGPAAYRVLRAHVPHHQPHR